MQIFTKIIIIIEDEVGSFEYAKAAQKNGYLYPKVSYGLPDTRDPLHPRTILREFLFLSYVNSSI
jgi:hypothetical protein